MITGIVKTKSFADCGYRFDPDIHLSEGVRVRQAINKLPYEISNVGENAEKVFYGNIFSRVFVEKPERGVEYLAASDTVLADLHTGRYLSKAQSEALSYLKLKRDWILVTCSGTLGNVTYTNSTYEDKIVTHDLIRIVPNDNKVKRGVLYAFLSSKYGYHQITQSQFGGVVKHINDIQTRGIKVPVFPIDLQNRVDALVRDSSTLREEATNAIDKARKIIDNIFEGKNKIKDNKVSIRSIVKSHNTRFEGFYHTSKNRSIFDYITSNYSYITLKDMTEKIFRPGIFKREYVANGVTFLGGADILSQIPSSDKKLSYRQVEKMPELRVKRGWILVTCGGTIGNTVCIDNQLAQCAISQHVMRIVPKENIKKGYLYAFLSSKIGHELITLYTSGSVIPQIEAHHLERVPIPILEEEIMNEINGLVDTYITKLEESKQNELLAIQIIEQEIEKWNK